jgi:putative ABC transport system permease protein
MRTQSSDAGGSNIRPRSRRTGPAIWYRARADLRGRRVQTGSVLLLVMLATLLVGLGLVVFGSVQAPFDTLFTRLNGAHLWLYADPHSPLTPAQVDAISQTPNVTGATGLEELAQGDVLLGTSELRANLRSFPVQQPAIGQLLITQGTGLSTEDPHGVIIDQAFASAHHLRVDDALTLVTTSGEQQMHVRGIAVDVNHDSQSDGTVCELHLLRATLDSFYAPSQRFYVIGLRLADPSATSATFASISDRLQAQGYADPNRNLGWDDWLAFRASFGSASRVSATLLLAFGIVSLFAAGVIVVNLVMGQVLAQQRDLGILKAIGFTPLQLVRTIVLEYVALGALGGVLGLVLVALVSPPLLAQLVSSLGVPVPPQYNLATGALLLALNLLVIGVSAGLPAWRAGRTRVADAIRPGGAAPRRGLTRLASLLLQGGMPVIAALGVRGIMGRPLRALLVWLTLIVGVMTAVFALGMTATIDRYAHDAALTGVFADVYLQPGLYDGQATQQLVASRPEVAYYFGSYEWPGQVASGANNRLSVIFTTGDTRRIAATLSSGRWYSPSADEIVLGDQAMQHFRLRLGDRIPLIFSLASGQQVTIPYTVVGTLFATQRADEAYTTLSTLTTRATIPTDELLARMGYEVTLRQGVSADAFAQALQQVSAGRVGVKVYDLNPPPAVTEAVGIMAILSALLMVIAAVGILNAMLLSTRERLRELGTLKAIGLTPSQMVRSVIEGAILLGALSLAVGIPVGLALTAQGLQALVDSQGGLPHFQMGINWPALALLIPATLLVAALGAYLPARWAARVPVSVALREE